jgi:hypothetical protein
MTQCKDESWDVRGYESRGRGIAIEMRQWTENGTRYSLFTLPPSGTLGADILLAMIDTRQNVSQTTSLKNSYGQTV